MLTHRLMGADKMSALFVLVDFQEWVYYVQGEGMGT